MKRQAFSSILLASAVAAFSQIGTAAAADSAATTKAMADFYAKAKAEGSLNVYSVVATDIFAKIVSDFNKSFDPRVFQAAYLNHEERAKMVATLSAKEKDTFRRRFNEAVTKGWIPDPRGGGNAQ